MSATRQRGMTLAEIILVIAVGMVMLASGTMMYQQARQSAGAAKARDKVASAQQLVESMATQSGGAFPTLDQFAQAWIEKRTQDHDTSPWGGKISKVGWSTLQYKTVPTAKPGYEYKGVDGKAGGKDYPVGKQDLNSGKYHPVSKVLNYIYLPNDQVEPGREGQIDYYRLEPSAAGESVAEFFETTINATFSVRNYAVSIRDGQTRPVYFSGGAPVPGR